MIEMKLRSPRTILDDLSLYSRMLKKLKVPLLPHITRSPHHVKPLPQAARSVAYYPGCSLDGMAVEFNHSAQAVCQALDIHLVEPKGWVCCGSSAAHRSDPEIALNLPMKNLTLVEQSGFSTVAMPCAACFNRHQAALHEIRQQPEHRQAFEQSAGYAYQDSIRVLTMTQLLLESIGTEAVAARVRKPLTGLKLVCYYGCLLTRPPEVTGVTNPENPTDMDQLMEALGAEVLDWSYKTTCCGAAHSLTRPDIVLKLSGRLIEQARLSGADMIVVACPLCHLNLDARQFQMELENPMPILYFTQLMALALDLPPKAACLGKNLVDPKPILRQKGVLAPI